VAICGLAGALIVRCWWGLGCRGWPRVVLVYWCGALVASRWGPGLLLVGVAGGVVAQGVAMVAGIVIAAVIGRPVANPHL
jgi:hypothetical protein